MKHLAIFDQPKEIKIILRDSYQDNLYYGLDEFDCKYLKIIQSKFGCLNSFHTIPDRVKMEMTPYEWSEKLNKFILADKKSYVVQLNNLEVMIVNYSLA
jgi:hypothetical protein